MSTKEMFKRPGDTSDIGFSINGVKHNVSDKFPATTTLNDYIRDVAGLKGTKIYCKEAGCGSCAVAVTHTTDNNKAETMSINSCLCPLYSVDGWQISTVEGIGSQKDGFHPIQERLAKYNGTQCGYCSPGFVMSMYGLLHQNPNATQQDIEDSFDGHICRCTGYRSILDAMKSFGSDSKAEEKAIDIEDLNKHLCPKTGEVCKAKGEDNTDGGVLPRKLELDLREAKWYRPLDLRTLTQIMKQNQKQSIRLCFGNTSTGIFKHEGPFDVYIDLKAISDLYNYKENETHIHIGAGTTLTMLMNHMKNLQDKPGYQYSKGILRHLKVVASVLVRNAGCIGGNLMIKHANPDFPSDIFTMMEAIGAKINILDCKNSLTDTITLMEFLKEVDMKGKVIVSVEFPKWNAKDHYRSYKITPRWQNAHAYVNAAFKIPVENRLIIGQPNIVFGGISADMVHAIETEQYLKGKTLSDQTIKEALKTLASELKATAGTLIATPKYRQDLATNLLYKTLLKIYKPTQYKLQSGGESMDRPLSIGLQTFQEKRDEFPLKQALPKKTAPFQTSGEAEYINDIPTFQQELAAAMVVSSVGIGTIKDVDTTEALNIPGVVKYIGCKDLPEGGVNNALVANMAFSTFHEEVFASKEVDYAGRVIGIVLAETSALAEEGARKVKVMYENVQTPVIELEDAIAKNAILENGIVERTKGDTEEAMTRAAYVVEGEIKEGTQAHFYIENQIALCVPTEDGLDVYSTAQWLDFVQMTVSKVINKPMNYVNVITPRIGGAFGGKINNAPGIAAAAAVAAETTRRPIRLNVDLPSNMSFSGKRFPVYAEYRAGCDAEGKMMAVEITVYVDSGTQRTPMTFDVIEMCDQGYYVPNWKIKMLHMKTNKPMAAAMRGPGSVPGNLIIETIMEHLAKKIGKHPILFKEFNLYEKHDTDAFGFKLEHCTVKACWQKLKQIAEISGRIEDVKRFNKNNLWRKKGITMSSIKYAMEHGTVPFPSSVSIFVGDGTVTVFTSGTEMGQGLYMKVAQAVAKTLGVPLDDVKVKPNQTNVNPNPMFTAASTSSERCVASAILACEDINERLRPIREKKPDADWMSVIKEAYFNGIPLFESAMAKSPAENKYFTNLAGAVETEVDVLTGEFQIKRVDIMADFGESMNPTIDIGQVEGAFVMGLGAYLTENVIYSPTDGRVLNDGTWEYKPPTTKDIPIDWRVHFLPDSTNPIGVLSSKATGEPAIGLGVGALMSIKAAVENVREELTSEQIFLPVEAPFTVEKVQLSTKIAVDHLHVSRDPSTVATQ